MHSRQSTEQNCRVVPLIGCKLMFLWAHEVTNGFLLYPCFPLKPMAYYFNLLTNQILRLQRWRLLDLSIVWWRSSRVPSVHKFYYFANITAEWGNLASEELVGHDNRKPFRADKYP